MMQGLGAAKREGKDMGRRGSAAGSVRSRGKEKTASEEAEAGRDRGKSKKLVGLGGAAHSAADQGSEDAQ